MTGFAAQGQIGAIGCSSPLLSAFPLRNGFPLLITNAGFDAAGARTSGAGYRRFADGDAGCCSGGTAPVVTASVVVVFGRAVTGMFAAAITPVALVAAEPYI